MFEAFRSTASRVRLGREVHVRTNQLPMVSGALSVCEHLAHRGFDAFSVAQVLQTVRESSGLLSCEAVSLQVLRDRQREFEHAARHTTDWLVARPVRSSEVLHERDGGGKGREVPGDLRELSLKPRGEVNVSRDPHIDGAVRKAPRVLHRHQQIHEDLRSRGAACSNLQVHH